MIINKTNAQVTKIFNLLTQTGIDFYLLKILATIITALYCVIIKMFLKHGYRFRLLPG